MQAARDAFVDTYGGGEGVKIITAHRGYDHSGQTLDAHLRPMSRGDDGLDEQARREVNALPKYGEAGWSKRSLTQIRQGAARRAAAGQQAPPVQSEREALAGLKGREDGTWSEIRRNAGQQFLAERNRAMARKWEPKR